MKLRTTVFHKVRFEILHLPWTRIEIKSTDFLKVRVYTVLMGIKLRTTAFLRFRVGILILTWAGIKLRTTVFHRVRFEILHLSWTIIELKTTTFLSPPSQLLNSAAL